MKSEARGTGGRTALERVMFMVGLVVAGEAVFALPFHVARFLRAPLLEALGLSNTELGAAQAAYGVAAMLAYFPGGLLADRFSARKLLALSLVATAAGGLHLATLPGRGGAIALWGFWGMSTILLFWGALIRATRDWGGAGAQGRAYGYLDGGRGLLAAGLASLAAALFGAWMPDDVAAASLADKRTALRMVIHAYTAVTLATAGLVWLTVSDTVPVARARDRGWLAQIGRVVRLPAVWLQALIVVCAYVGYKGLDDYSLYAVQCLGMNEVEAAEWTALAAWIRPFAAVGAGVLADRVRSSRVIVAAFTALVAFDLYFATAAPTPGGAWLLMGNMLVAAAAVFALRGVYFALFEEAEVPVVVTGTATGVVSVIGYTPDVFVGLVGGMLLDRSPGLTGHQHYFLFLAAFAALGVVASLTFIRVLRR